MEHDTQRSQTSSKADATTRDATAPGRSSRSAVLCKCDQAVASGLVKKFTPPKRGVTTANVSLRSAPKTGAGSAELETIATDSVMTIQSEVQSTDPGHPKWFGVEIDQRDGFVVAPLVRIEDGPSATEQATAGSTHAGGAPPPERAPDMKTDDPLFAGQVEQMRLKGEFDQFNTKRDTTVNHASLRAFKQRGYRDDELERKSEKFRKNVCNLMAMFFIKRANDLRSRSRALKDNYPGFKQLVENWMTDYFVHALQDNLVREDGWVNVTDPLDLTQGCRSHDSPYKKAQQLLKCEGKLIEIDVGGHYFLGRVKDGFLHAYDNNRREGRSGKFNLEEVTPESTSGTTYLYLKNVLKSAYAAKGSGSADDDAAQVEPSTTQPHATLDSPRAAGADHVHAFTPPRLGAATTAVNLRSAPTTNSAKRMTIDPRSAITLQSEMQTADPSYPRWFGAEVSTRSGFVAAPFVKLEDTPKDTEPTGASEHAAGPDGAHAGGSPSPSQAPGMKTDDPLFSGHLARMRREGEFLQIVPQADKGTIHKASLRAFENKGYTGATLARKAREFRDAACNIMALFFIERAPDLRSRTEALKDDYAGYKQQVEDWMTSYFTDALHSGLVKESGWVTSNAALDQSEGCSARDTPYQKAQGLLKCEGRLIRIHVDGHFFIGEVKGGILHADDNQGDDRKRSGEFVLAEVTPDAKTGKTYRYLKDVLVSASPERAGAANRGVNEQTGPSRAQPASGPTGAPECEC